LIAEPHRTEEFAWHLSIRRSNGTENIIARDRKVGRIDVSIHDSAAKFIRERSSGSNYAEHSMLSPMELKIKYRLTSFAFPLNDAEKPFISRKRSSRRLMGAVCSLCCCRSGLYLGSAIGALDLASEETMIRGVNLTAAALQHDNQSPSLLPAEAATFQVINPDSSSSDLDTRKLNDMLKSLDDDGGEDPPGDVSDGSDSDAN
jgi:hypothetical protein